LNDLAITPNLVVFAALSLIAICASLGVIFAKDAIRGALCLVVNFFILSFLYFSLNAQFLGIVQVVVYTGAIMVLFLFVIMLLNLGGVKLLQDRFDAKKPFAVVMGLILLVGVGSQLLPGLPTSNPAKGLADYGAPPAVGRTLFTEYAVPFECVSVLLLIGIVGSILLAKRKI
jgi:NADH-quinone oxidoreductase subunit J